MTVKIIMDRHRLLIHAFGWSLVDLDVLTRLPAPKPASSGRPENPPPPPQDRDMTGTVCSQVEQGSEPSPGFGFAGTVGTVVARDPGRP